MSAKHDQGDKNNHKRTIHKRVIQVPQEVISEASEQRPQDTPDETKMNRQGLFFFEEDVRRVKQPHNDPLVIMLTI